MSVRSVSISEAAIALKRSDAVLLDVRTAVEFDELHAAGSYLVPVSRFDPYVVGGRSDFQGKTLYFMCKSGYRAHQVAERCVAAGFENVAVVEGGISQWKRAGLPVEGRLANRKPMVRLNPLLLSGCALGVGGMVGGLLIHPALLTVSLLGAGLVFGALVGIGMGRKNRPAIS